MLLIGEIPIEFNLLISHSGDFSTLILSITIPEYLGANWLFSTSILILLDFLSIIKSVADGFINSNFFPL